jgi:hypothetical protein
MKDMKYIRDKNVVYQQDSIADNKFRVMQVYKSINEAKRFTRQQPLGDVARKDAIIREKGEKFYKELIS